MFEERFQRDGYLVVDRLFEPALVDAVRKEVERQHGAIDLAQPPDHLEVGHRRLQLPVALTGPLLDPALYAQPVLLTILKCLLGERLAIDNISCVIAYPGAKEQELHRDHPDLFARKDGDFTHLPPFAVTVAVPLVDLTEESGTTEIFGGSHRAALDADNQPESLGGSESPMIARGGCMLVDYRTWHRGTPNRSSRQRPILYLIYTRPWFTDFRNFDTHAAIQIDHEALLSIPRQHRALFRRAVAKGRLDMTVEQFLSA